jgi:parallel beta-helix repeat protein
MDSVEGGIGIRVDGGNAGRANRVRILVALCGILVSVLIAINLDVRRVAAADTCTESLQAKVDAAQPGETVVAQPCIYREQVTINKPITLQGQPGSEIRGSDVWSEWNYDQQKGYWTSTKTIAPFPQSEVYCLPNTERCQWPEQVFLDGKALFQVGSSPKVGQFAVDDERRVVLKDDPAGHLVEVAVRRHWVLGTAAADGVTIEGFKMKHAANDGRSGALMNREDRLVSGGSSWTLRNNVLSDAHGAIVSLTNAPGHEILNNDISYGGKIGIHGAGRGSIIRGNKIHHNNTQRFAYSAATGMGETGGIKLIYAQDTVFDSNEVYANYGHGIHYDVDCYNNIISRNRVHDNARMGISYEISSGAKIFGNVVWNNGWATPIYPKGSGITVLNSSDVELYRNTLAWNADGISIAAHDRPGTQYDRVHDVHVHDNTILGKNRRGMHGNHVALGWLQGEGNTLYSPNNNNWGANNRYWYPTRENSLERYRWNNTFFTKLSDFNRTGGESRGIYLTQSKKNAVLANNGIPGP